MKKAYRVFALILTILIIAVTAFFAFELVTLNVLPSKLYIPIFAVLVLVDLIFILLVNFYKSMEFVLSQFFFVS